MKKYIKEIVLLVIVAVIVNVIFVWGPKKREWKLVAEGERTLNWIQTSDGCKSNDGMMGYTTEGVEDVRFEFKLNIKKGNVTVRMILDDVILLEKKCGEGEHFFESDMFEDIEGTIFTEQIVSDDAEGSYYEVTYRRKSNLNWLKIRIDDLFSMKMMYN